MNILVLNAGSSSLKMCLYAMDGIKPLTEPETVLAIGEIERIAAAGTRLQLTIGQSPQVSRTVTAANIAEAADQMMALLLAPDTNGGEALTIDAVGHRIVHGGPQFVAPVRIDAGVLKDLQALVALAPLHMPGCVAGVEAGASLLPDTPAVAVFDTAFHHNLPDVTAHYALPQDLAAEHQLRRYGFHGISYQYVMERTLLALGRNAAGTRFILCHLGGGASVCAVKDGKSIDVSMGFTPLEGLIMGTRSGDVDAGLVLYLLKALHMSVDDVEKMLNKKSGLLGISGLSDDVRDLEKATSEGNTDALAALEAFAYRVRKYIGAYAAALGGLDALIFTDKIGAHATLTRSRICQGLDFLGLGLDPVRNVDISGQTPTAIGTGDGQKVWVVPTDEERQIAREVYALLTYPGVVN